MVFWRLDRFSREGALATLRYLKELTGQPAGELHYVTGPHFEAYAPEVDLGELFAIGLANGDDHTSVMRLLNQYLGDHGTPVTAQLHVCQGLAEAIHTLSALVTAHTLLAKR